MEALLAAMLDVVLMSGLKSTLPLLRWCKLLVVAVQKALGVRHGVVNSERESRPFRAPREREKTMTTEINRKATAPQPSRRGHRVKLRERNARAPSGWEAFDVISYQAPLATIVPLGADAAGVGATSEVATLPRAACLMPGGGAPGGEQEEGGGRGSMDLRRRRVPPARVARTPFTPLCAPATMRLLRSLQTLAASAYRSAEQPARRAGLILQALASFCGHVATW